MSVGVAVLFDGAGAHVARNGDATSSPVSRSLDEIARELRQGQERLRAVSIDDIVGLCDAASQAWVQPGSPAAAVIAEFAIGFLPLWLRRANLSGMCDVALRGTREAADRFVPISNGSKQLHRAHPRGILVHWMAGNVPLLGMISVVQGLLSKNANLIKVARRNAGVLPFFLEELTNVRYTRPDGSVVEGRVLTDAVRVVYADRDDGAAASALSVLADVRIAWGGREAVESIMNLPRRFGTEDIVFGPKTSFAIVGQEMLNDETAARRVARAAALDAAALEQRGCNSPHTVFVERHGDVPPSRFAELIAEELGGVCARLPLPALTAPEAFNVLGYRAEYDMRGEAWYSEGVSWGVLYSDDDRGLASPCYARTLFVRPVDDIFDAVPLCSIHTQTAGLAVSDRRLALADALTARGIERCTELGRMSAYSNPWDGIYPIDRMVRWVSA
jgi:hypothetical protein